MLRSIVLLLLVISSALLIDQAIKTIFLDGFRLYSPYIDLILVFNKGVAFSMFAFLEGALKWIQLTLLVGVIGYTLWLKRTCYLIPVGILVGSGLSNVADRFMHGGVVDYVYWHYGFNFAVFNAADVMIDFAVLWLLLLNFRPQSCKG